MARHPALPTRAPLLAYGVDAGIGESDNVTLVSTNKINQSIATADADFAVNEQSRLLDVNAKGDFSYLDYLQNAYSSQLLGRFDGAANAVHRAGAFHLGGARRLWASGARSVHRR